MLSGGRWQRSSKQGELPFSPSAWKWTAHAGAVMRARRALTMRRVMVVFRWEGRDLGEVAPSVGQSVRDSQ